jgi:sporulation protein YabP
MAEERKIQSMPHNLVLEDRKLLTVSGVSDVDSFDEETVVVFTDLGELTIRGSNLHINRLSVEVGELSVEGNISALIYSDEVPKSGGFFSRVFR